MQQTRNGRRSERRRERHDYFLFPKLRPDLDREEDPLPASERPLGEPDEPLRAGAWLSTLPLLPLQAEPLARPRAGPRGVGACEALSVRRLPRVPVRVPPR